MLFRVYKILFRVLGLFGVINLVKSTSNFVVLAFDHVVISGKEIYGGS